MKITENINKGLKRELQITIAKDDMVEKRNARLEELKDKIKVNGFRPGKVPMAHIIRLYGKSVMAELVDEIVKENTKKLLLERKEQVAQQPKISMTEDKDEAEIILDGKKDFAFTIAYEIIPDFEIIDLKKIKIEKQIVEISKQEIKAKIEEIAKNNINYEIKKGKAEKQDRILFDYTGKIEGEAFEGGTNKDAHLVLGSNTFIPGFEEKLIGVEAGAKKTIDIQFPKDYPAKNLANKKATFDVVIHKVEKPIKAKLDDEFAKSLGVESFAKLETLVEQQIQSQYEQDNKQKMKEQILDELEKNHKFELPENIVAQEFEFIWQEMLSDLQRQKKTFKDEGTTEEKQRKKYQTLAQRRIRLRFIMGKIGEAAKIEVSEEEIKKSLQAQAQQYPGREKEIIKFFQQDATRLESLRAPIYEEKVISYILENVTLQKKLDKKN